MVAWFSPVSAEDAYQVGVTGALRGRSAASYAPVIEALRLYIEKVNAAGGVNGKPINLLIEDDLALPWKAGANTQENGDRGQSGADAQCEPFHDLRRGRYRGKERRRAADFRGIGLPEGRLSARRRRAFCTTAFAAKYDSRAALAFVQEAATEPVKIAFVAMAIPRSRLEIDFAAGEASRLGMTVVYKEGILPPTEDYTPFANSIKDAGANWVYSWAPWVTQIRTYEALRQIGWSGSYVTWAHTEAEAELERIKDPKLYVVSANALFADALPIQKEIVAAMKRPAANIARNR